MTFATGADVRPDGDLGYPKPLDSRYTGLNWVFVDTSGVPCTGCYHRTGVLV